MISSKISLLTIGITTLYPQALGALGGHPTFLAHAASTKTPGLDQWDKPGTK